MSEPVYRRSSSSQTAHEASHYHYFLFGARGFQIFKLPNDPQKQKQHQTLREACTIISQSTVTHHLAFIFLKWWDMFHWNSATLTEKSNKWCFHERKDEEESSSLTQCSTGRRVVAGGVECVRIDMTRSASQNMLVLSQVKTFFCQESAKLMSENGQIGIDFSATGGKFCRHRCVPWPEAESETDLYAQPVLFVCQRQGVKSHTRTKDGASDRQSYTM